MAQQQQQQQQQHFTFGLQKPEDMQQQQQQNYAAAAAAPPPPHGGGFFNQMGAPAAAVAPVPVSSINFNGGSTVNFNGAAAAAAVGSSEPVKRKRGRPKKYGPNGPTTSPAPAGAAAPATPTSAAPHFPPGAPAPHFATAAPAAPFAAGAYTPPGAPGFPAAAAASATPAGATTAPAAAADVVASASTGPVKKSRGRPRGSVNKPRVVKGPGGSLAPHVITVKAGECLPSKIVSLSQDVRHNVCILAANGTISRVSLRHPSSSGSVTYEGRFEIVKLGGSYLLCDGSGPPRRSGGLNVTLSGPDGHIMGGGVAGELIAASAVQIVLLSFPGESSNESNLANQMVTSSAPPKVATAGQSSSPSRGTLSESSGGPSGGPGSPHN